MVKRIWIRRVRDALGKFPAVALLGSRQCGKTTLARQLPGIYLDMEAPEDRLRLDAEWGALVGGSRLLIIDEAQQVPWVFSRLRGAIDADRKRNGRFLLLGSVSPTLARGVSESLARRMGRVRMTPFLLSELEHSQVDSLWMFGGYPDGGILKARMYPEWQRSYLDALVGRDLPAWGLPARPQGTMRLLAMLGAVQGQPLNASQLGASLSLDHKTVLRYCDHLEDAFLIRRLPPFLANIRKRLVKAPRIYWRDSGLLHALHAVKDMEQLYRQPWVGQSWEGFAIEQTLGVVEAGGTGAQGFHFRTSDGYELDLVLDWGNERWAVEVKLTSGPTQEMVSRLNKTADMVGATQRILVCRVARPVVNDRLLVAPLAVWLERAAGGPR